MWRFTFLLCVAFVTTAVVAAPSQAQARTAPHTERADAAGILIWLRRTPAANSGSPDDNSAVANPVTTTRVSIASDGAQGMGDSWNSAISTGGWCVAFRSDADNLVAGDANERDDIFVHWLTGETRRVSVASDGTEGNDHSRYPAISADGRYVAFASLASNLVNDDSNGAWDIFVRDQQTGQTSRVSVASDGTEANAGANFPAISADGRYVAFVAAATNLVSGDTNGRDDIFVHDRQTGQTSRVSVASNGAQANLNSTLPVISVHSRYVAFVSDASNLVSGDTNGDRDIFIHDRVTGQTRRVSVASNGMQANNSSYWAAISATGRYVAFASLATNLVSGDTNGWNDIFVHDRLTGQTSRVSVASDGVQGNAHADTPAISADGRYVLFDSQASNLVGDDTNGVYDVFVHDRATGQTSRVSVASGGTQANRSSFQPAISSDARFIAFWSFATNLVSGDTNGFLDVFVHDRGP
ncbi:MAG: PD40 domain-containing protein [Candidatus Promineifilaceae bacterium]